MSRTYGTIKYAPPHRTLDTYKRGLWVITGTPDVMLRLKRMFPKADTNRAGEIILEHSDEVCRDVEWILSRWAMLMRDEDHARLRTGARAYRETQDLVERLLTGDRPHIPGMLEPARQPRDYQLIAADLAIATGRLLVADELGLGKTMTGLLTLRNPDLLPALVVCPTHLPKHWERELAKTFPTLRCHVIKTGTPYDPAGKRAMRGYDPDVLIINYHKLRTWADHLAGQVKTVIFDEAQELRKCDSAKYKAAAQIADKALCKVGLTATPVYNYSGEIHNVLSVIAPDALGSKQEFAQEWAGNRYFDDKTAVKDPKALGAHLRSEGVMLRRTRKEVGRELPDVVRVPHGVDTDEDKLAALLEADGVFALAETILESGDRKEVFTARGEIDWKMRKATGVAKAPYVAAFVDLLLESEQKVILFGWHRDVYNVWMDRLADHNPVMITGSESPTQKELSRARFIGGDALTEHLGTVPRRALLDAGIDALEVRKAHEESNVLVMSLKSGSGIDGLQGVCNVGVFGELDWSPGIHDQCEGRYHRDGQADPCVSYFLVSDAGSDPVIADVLNVKEQGSRPIIDPDRPLFQPKDDHDRMRELAERVLAKRKRVAA